MTKHQRCNRYGTGEAAEAPVADTVRAIGGVMSTLHATIDVSNEVTLEKTKSEWRLSTAFCSVRAELLSAACLPTLDDKLMYIVPSTYTKARQLSCTTALATLVA